MTSMVMGRGADMTVDYGCPPAPSQGAAMTAQLAHREGYGMANRAVRQLGGDVERVQIPHHQRHDVARRGEGLEVHRREATLLQSAPAGVGAIGVRVPGPDEAVHASRRTNSVSLVTSPARQPRYSSCVGFPVPSSWVSVFSPASSSQCRLFWTQTALIMPRISRERTTTENGSGSSATRGPPPTPVHARSATTSVLTASPARTSPSARPCRAHDPASRPRRPVFALRP